MGENVYFITLSPTLIKMMVVPHSPDIGVMVDASNLGVAPHRGSD